MVEDHANWISGPQNTSRNYAWRSTEKFACPDIDAGRINVAVSSVGNNS